MGWFVLNKYYTLTDDTPAYAAAVLLDPTKRQAYIEKNWPSVWHSDVIGKVMQLWEQNTSTNESHRLYRIPSKFRRQTRERRRTMRLLKLCLTRYVSNHRLLKRKTR